MITIYARLKPGRAGIMAIETGHDGLAPLRCHLRRCMLSSANLCIGEPLADVGG